VDSCYGYGTQLDRLVDALDMLPAHCEDSLRAAPLIQAERDAILVRSMGCGIRRLKAHQRGAQQAVD